MKFIMNPSVGFLYTSLISVYKGKFDVHVVDRMPSCSRIDSM